MKDGRAQGALRAAALAAATAVPGLHFLAGSLASAAVRRRPVAGLAADVAACILMYWLGGLEGALMCIATAAGLTAAGSARLSWSQSSFVTASACVVAAVASLANGPGIMGMTADLLEPLVPVYASAGIPEGQARAVMDTLVYLSPGTGAFQVAIGCILAARLAGVASGNGDQGSWRSLRLGLAPAWILICSLAASVAGDRTGMDWVARAGANILVFLAAPYGAVGMVILGEAARTRPFLLAAGLFLAVAATPVMAAAVLMTGVLDTWLDFRTRFLRH